MTLTMDVDENLEAAAAEAQSSGNGEFPPLMPGPYQATIIKVEGEKPWANDGPNANKKALRIRVQISSQSPNGRNRVYFVRIPMFTRFAPKKPGEQGKVAQTFFDFWQKVVGLTLEDIKAGRIPSEGQLIGLPLTIVLSDPIAPNQWNPLGYNDVSFVRAPGKLEDTPTNDPVLPWEIDANAPAPSYGGYQQQAPVPGADVWGQQQSAAPAGDVWSATPQPDAQLQAAAASSQGFN